MKHDYCSNHRADKQRIPLIGLKISSLHKGAGFCESCKNYQS